MIRRNYRLDNTLSKAAKDITLWQTEKGIVEISKNTLAIPIKLNNQQKGYIFHGHGKLLLDTIVETEEGAFGKPVEREIKELFLMLGNAKETRQHLTIATKEDLAEMGYENQQVFVAEAEVLLDRFLGGRVHTSRCFSKDHGFIFAFLNKAGKLDVLLVENFKMVYKALNMVFLSNRNIVLKCPDKTIISNNGKSLVIKKHLR